MIPHNRRPMLILVVAMLIAPLTALRAQDPEVDPIQRLETEVASLPLYGPDELRLDPGRLIPSRVIKRVEGAYLDEIFDGDLQVIVSLERGISTRPVDGRPVLESEGFWVRWRANTHNGIDEAWIDYETLGLRRTVAGYRNIAWFEPGRVTDITLSPDSASRRTVTALPETEFYWNVSLPYVFAAMDVPAGTSFRLNGFSTRSKRVYPIRVDVVGEAEFTDASGQQRSAWEVETRDPSTHITWFVDRERAPHYLGSIWRALDPQGEVIRVADEHPVSWHTFDRDSFGDRTRSRSP